MDALAYKSAREQRGTQEEVAAALGVSRVSVARRETGSRPVSREAWLALLALPKKRAARKSLVRWAAGAGRGAVSAFEQSGANSDNDQAQRTGTP